MPLRQAVQDHPKQIGMDNVMFHDEGIIFIGQLVATHHAFNFLQMDPISSILQVHPHDAGIALSLPEPGNIDALT